MKYLLFFFINLSYGRAVGPGQRAVVRRAAPRGGYGRQRHATVGSVEWCSSTTPLTITTAVGPWPTTPLVEGSGSPRAERAEIF